MALKGNPIPAFRFAVQIDSVLSNGWFTACSGLSITRQTEDVVQAGENAYIHKLAGRYEYGDITLKHGLFASDSSLWDWLTADIKDVDTIYKVKRYDIDIILYDFAKGSSLLGAASSTTKPARWWTVKQAFPTNWQIGDFSSTSTEIAIEELTLAHHGLSLQKAIT